MSDLSKATGRYVDGHVELDSTVDWEQGMPVTIVPSVPSNGDGNGLRTADQSDWGIDDNWPDTPENRAEILRRIDAVEPLEMTPEEEQEWQATLDWIGDYTLQAVKRDMGLAP